MVDSPKEHDHGNVERAERVAHAARDTSPSWLS